MFIDNFRKYISQDIKILSSLLIEMSEILHSKCKQYGIPYCSTERAMSMY